MSNKTIIVFGGTSGYGAGISAALRAKGYRVVAASRRTGTDVTNYTDVHSLVDEVMSEGGTTLSGVVYSAGMALGKDTIENGDPDNWAQVINTNALGLMHVAKAVLPYLVTSGGFLFSIGSIATEIAYAGAGDYCASKAAQTRIMQTLRYEWLGLGVRTCSLEVGLGDTNFQNHRYAGDMEKAASHYGSIKQLDPADIGNTISWIMEQPPHVNFDSLTIKPLAQAHHGHIVEG